MRSPSSCVFFRRLCIPRFSSTLSFPAFPFLGDGGSECGRGVDMGRNVGGVVPVPTALYPELSEPARAMLFIHLCRLSDNMPEAGEAVCDAVLLNYSLRLHSSLEVASYFDHRLAYLSVCVPLGLPCHPACHRCLPPCLPPLPATLSACHCLPVTVSACLHDGLSCGIVSFLASHNSAPPNRPLTGKGGTAPDTGITRCIWSSHLPR